MTQLNVTQLNVTQLNVTQLKALFFALSVVALAGCSCSDVSLGDDDAGLGDGGRVGPRPDECGNGLDDDGNGSIDDGCPCAPGETQRCFSGALDSSGVGACMGGTQTCAAISGSEWGDWGLSDCEGETLPSAEACDGRDADCDGAIDEGCPCTGGMERACGEEFITAPCMAGTQTCRGGTWSSCEGAVGPSADVCSDAIDNDCDGLTDDMCECPYPPAPERCRDGVDNDCDGVTDEPECTPDWPGECDAYRGPSCTPVVVDLLDGLGEAYPNGMAGGPCEVAVTFGEAGQLVLDRYAGSGSRLSRTEMGAGVGSTVSIAYGAPGLALLFLGTRPAAPLLLQLVAPDGSPRGAPRMLASSADDVNGGLIGTVAWNGAQWVAVWSSADGMQAALISPDGATVTPVDSPAGTTRFNWFAVGDELLAIRWTGGPSSRLFVSTFALDTVAPRVVDREITTGDLALNARAAWSGSRWWLGYMDLNTTPEPSPYRIMELTADLGVGAPIEILPRVADVDALPRAGAHLSVLAVDGDDWVAGRNVDMNENAEIVRFGSGTTAEPPVDIGGTSIPRVEGGPFTDALVSPRRTVLRMERTSSRTDARLHLLCAP